MPLGQFPNAGFRINRQMLTLQPYGTTESNKAAAGYFWGTYFIGLAPATLGLSGNITKKTLKKNTGTLNLSGAISKLTKKMLVPATLGLSGALIFPIIVGAAAAAFKYLLQPGTAISVGGGTPPLSASCNNPQVAYCYIWQNTIVIIPTGTGSATVTITDASTDTATIAVKVY